MFSDNLTGGQVVAGSNPAVPTNLANGLESCYLIFAVAIAETIGVPIFSTAVKIGLITDL